MIGSSVSSTASQGNSSYMEETVDSAMLDDEFMVNSYKVECCMLSQPHGWKVCPYVHPGEPVKRRHPSTHRGDMCPAVKKGGTCQFGADRCQWAHNSFELWLHPTRYKTKMCRRGADCPRGICFFAHSESELRQRPMHNGNSCSATNSTLNTVAPPGLALSRTAAAAATGSPTAAAPVRTALPAAQVPTSWASTAVQAVPAVQTIPALPAVPAVQSGPSWMTVSAAQAVQPVTAASAVHAPTSWAPAIAAQLQLTGCTPSSGATAAAACPALASAAALQRQLELLVVECSSSSCSSTNSSCNSSSLQPRFVSEQPQQQLDVLGLQQAIELHQLRMRHMEESMAMLQLLQLPQQQQQPSHKFPVTADATQPLHEFVAHPACSVVPRLDAALLAPSLARSSNGGC